MPDYRNLDASGEARSAAQRMEARAQEPASEGMFRALVAPLITPDTRSVLEFGCGTAALSRRVARLAPHARVLATDKSAGMLEAARTLARAEGSPPLDFREWDATDEAATPEVRGGWDLVLSSVVTVYLAPEQVEALVARLARRLAPGGVLAFLEQDLMTDSANDPSGLFARIAAKDGRDPLRSQPLGLRAALRRAGLRPLARESFLWTDDAYGPYARALLERFADSAASRGLVTAQEAGAFRQGLEAQAAAGDFYYGLVYHRVAGRAGAAP